MLETVLYALLIIGGGLLALSIHTRAPHWTLLSAVTFISCGALLFSGVGIGEQEIIVAQLNAGGTYDMNVFSAFPHTVATDPAMNLMAYLLFFGGLVLIVVTFLDWRKSRQEEADE